MTDFELGVLEDIKEFAGQDFHKYGLQYWSEKYWDEFLGANVKGYDLSEYAEIFESPPF